MSPVAVDVEALVMIDPPRYIDHEDTCCLIDLMSPGPPAGASWAPRGGAAAREAGARQPPKLEFLRSSTVAPTDNAALDEPIRSDREEALRVRVPCCCSSDVGEDQAQLDHSGPATWVGLVVSGLYQRGFFGGPSFSFGHHASPGYRSGKCHSRSYIYFHLSMHAEDISCWS